MAEEKNSFLLYADWLATFEALEDHEAGKFIKHILRYVNDLNPVMEDRTLRILFEPIKQQLRRDLEKWERIKTKRSEAGKKSAGSKSEQKQQVLTNVESEDQKQQVPTNSTVNVNDTVNVNGNVNVINSQKSVRAASDFDFHFVEDHLRIPFETWFDYCQQKKPFEVQVSVEIAYRELKEMSKNSALEAMKIVQYSISNRYISLCKKEDRNKAAASTEGVKATVAKPVPDT